MSEWNGALQLLSLAPGSLGHAIAIFGFLFALNYTLRTALMTEGTRSVAVHAVVCVLTLLPAFALAFVLVFAAWRFPERAWINLGVAALLYAAWAAGGAITRFARPDTEGADIGWLAMGALITFPCGVIAALL